MSTSRRELFRTVGGISLATAFGGQLTACGGGSGGGGVAYAQALPVANALPDKKSFTFEGVHINAAFTHPLSSAGAQAMNEYVRVRQHEADRIGPGSNPRNAAVEAFARLINANAAEVVVVPSTIEAENMIASALEVEKYAGVVTDALHYDACLAMYGEMSLRGMPLTVVAPRLGSIDLKDLEAAIAKQRPRLVAVSMVSSTTGFQYDLKALSDLAHSYDALVYADVIQAAGAVPIDVKASGVDFCGCGGYKRLMGDFGAAFLYVRGDRLDRLKRVFVGWRQLQSQVSHVLPFETAGVPLGEWTLKNDTIGKFEVSSPAWGALAGLAGSIEYIQSLGVDAIVRHRQPLIDKLQSELPRFGFKPLTPAGSTSPIVSFAYAGASAKFRPALTAANIRISTYENRVRISPSVYNDMQDIERLIAVLST